MHAASCFHPGTDNFVFEIFPTFLVTIFQLITAIFLAVAKPLGSVLRIMESIAMTPGLVNKKISRDTT